MKTTAGSKVVSVSGKVYTATGHSFTCGGVHYLEIEATEENDFKRTIELRSVASVEAA